MTESPRATGDTASRVWSAMHSFVTDQDRRRSVREALDLGPVKAALLIKLAQGQMTLREIARAIDVDPSAATVAVDKLEDRGLVRRTPHPDDNRRKLVHLTATGRAATARVQQILSEAPPALAALPAEDLALLEEILTRLDARTEPVSVRPIPGRA
jgi:DNA-binding MarR family transcriptional regulator